MRWGGWGGEVGRGRGGMMGGDGTRWMVVRGGGWVGGWVGGGVGWGFGMLHKKCLNKMCL